MYVLSEAIPLRSNELLQQYFPKGMDLSDIHQNKLNADVQTKGMRTMLVTFRTKAYSNITMFGDVAIRLLKLMGHSGTVPSAILPEDIPAALERLRTTIAAEEGTSSDEGRSEDDEHGEAPVSLKNRASPLIQLLEAAVRENAPVRWEA